MANSVYHVDANNCLGINVEWITILGLIILDSIYGYSLSCVKTSWYTKQMKYMHNVTGE